ncbi:MAG: coproporphyrinogen III oxidase [Rhodospirillales bacterium]|nr:coproporphyrinogen III oxidase [Rhodospirillales bacterium]
MAFGIYVHWPFCASKCPYCDFNSHVHDTIDHAAWRGAYERELSYYAALTAGRAVSSIFFGGGTPSLMQPETTAHIIETIRRLWPVNDDVEITLEANPSSVEAGKFKGFRQAGVNRVSLGVQSFDDEALKFLGRRHDVGEARAALDIAADTFARYSFDLIYARPQQNVRDWQQELETALQYAGGHLSLYQLTIEQGTPFYQMYNRGEFSIPAEETAGDLYETTQSVLNIAGLPAYEISNHARAGQESRHNLVYWRYQDYVGVGPGAHGRLTIDGVKQATRTHRAPEEWLRRVDKDGHGGHPFETLDAQARVSEALLMGMRLSEGVPFSRIEDEGGEDWQAFVAPAKVKALQDEGLLTEDPDRLCATPAGFQRLNGILRYLL